MREGFIEQKTDPADRRRRRLYLTPVAEGLERILTEKQSGRIARAYREAGAEAVAGFRTVLRGIINEDDRHRFADGEPGRG